MSRSQWYRLYGGEVAASPEVLFELLSGLPHHDRGLPGSGDFGQTADVEPYAVRLGTCTTTASRDEPGRDWWGRVTGFQPPGSIDFHHTLHVRQLRATVDVHIQYSFEMTDKGTLVGRWLLLDFTMPVIFRPLRAFIVSRFDKVNVGTLDAVRRYAQAMAH